MAGWTVIGYWDDADYPISVGVVAGEQFVQGGEGCSDGGPWATFVDAPTAAEAELRGVQDMEQTGFCEVTD